VTAAGDTDAGGGSAWDPATLSELRPGLVLVESRVEDFDVRAVVVTGTAGAMVWDTLAHPRQMDGAARLVAGIPTQVVYSHADWDHVWGTAALEEVAEVVGHAACAARFVDEVPSELRERRKQAPDAWRAVRLVPPTRTFQDRTSVKLGDVQVEIRHLPGHTADCCVAWIPAWGVLLAGDTVETPVPVVNDAAAVPSWIAGLRRLLEIREVATVVPSHGPVGGPELIAATAAYLQALSKGHSEAPGPGAAPFYHGTHRRNLGFFRES
jgi:glyoxylase-like metal-dependent hydrolase (beta-lactamase superfamily II)